MKEKNKTTNIGKDIKLTNTKKSTKSLSAESLDSKLKNIKENNFPIVAIGASAGGLEAFEEFFRNIASNSGIAFILVSHLDPDHVSMLAEILQRCTEMPVREAQDKMVVEPNHVYVIPPKSDMAIFHGALQLSIPEKIRGQRLPIDYFFRSLAEDQGARSIAVILSGTGTDGTLGFRAILGAGGTTFVQDPATAKYDGMPASAVRNNLATYILAVDKIPQKLLSYVNNNFKKEARAFPAIENSTVYDTREILKIIRSATSHDFSLYKQATIGRRIERRMEANNIKSINDYGRYLRGNPAETQILFKELLINVTNFFRDPEAFDILKKAILSQLFLDKPENYCFRMWVPGCSSGEEAYSIAISLREYMDEIKQDFKIQIYGTDISEESIIAARLGVYPENITTNVSPDRLKRFFIKDGSTYRVKKEIRGMVTFAVQDAINDPPFIKLDFISCRNLLIYLELSLQKLLISIFSYALIGGGILFLGSAETIGSQTDLFAAIDKRHKFFKSTPSAASKYSEMVGNFAFRNIQKREKLKNIGIETVGVNLAEEAKMELLKSYAPSSVVIDKLGNILFVHGDTGKYLSHAPGLASLNIIEMAIKELKLKISTAIRNAVAQKKQIEYNNITVKSNGDTQIINLIVRPFTVADPTVLLIVSFQEINKKWQEEASSVVKLSTSKKESRYIEELEKELAFEKESLSVTTQEAQASTEELKSANEELQSANEELQSTNEELDTSREEMQSVNEELITVNSELSAKIDQLAEIQNDLKNLLENINVGTIFLDEKLNIKRYTKLATALFHLISTDIGRPFSDINSEVIIGELITKARHSLEMFTTHEEELLASDGKWYLMRILPYRTTEEVVDGVVITFTDISALKKVEASYWNASELAENILNIFNTVREPLLTLDKDLRVISANKSFYDSFKVTPEETEGNLIYNLGNKQWDIPKLRTLLEEILPKDNKFDDYEVEHEFLSIGRKTMLLNARRIIQKEPFSQIILLAIEDITERREIENGLKKARRELETTKISEHESREYSESLINTIREPLIALDQDLRVVTVSRSFYEFFKVKPEDTVGQLIYDLGNKQWDIPRLRELLETILPQKTTFDNYEVEHDFATVGRRIMLLNARQIQRVLGKERIILLAIEDITERREIENGLEKARRELEITKISEDESREYSESIIDTIREPLISLDQDLRVVSASRSFYEFFKVKPEDTVGQLIYDLGNKQWDIPKLRELLETILPQKTTFDNYEVEHDFATVGRRIMLLNARQIQRVLGKERIILLAIEDITERKKNEAARAT